jgi:hypothetical protein
LLLGVWWAGIFGAAVATVINKAVAIAMRQYFLNQLIGNVTKAVAGAVGKALIAQAPILIGAVLVWAIWREGGWLRDAITGAALLVIYLLAMGSIIGRNKAPRAARG